MHKLQLRLPETKFTAEQAHKVTPKGVEQWLQSIDYSNSAKAHHYYLETLKKINRLDIPLTIRLEVMELLEPVAAAILSELIHKTNTANTPLNEKHLENSQQIQYLLLEISVGYKIIIKDITEDETLVSQYLGNILPKACFRVIHSLSCLLIERYQKYLSEPSYVWFELNQIYHLAEGLGIYDLDIIDNQSINSEYLRIAIIRIADPYRLMPYEIRKLHELMADWSKYCRIEMLADKNFKEFHLVDLGKELAPNNCWAFSKISKENTRLFNLNNLKFHIDKKLREHSDPLSQEILTIKERLDREMLLRFRQQLSFLGHKKEQRSAANEKISLVIGMTACHYFIRGEKNFDPDKEIKAAKNKSRKKNITANKGHTSRLSLVSLGDENLSFEKKDRIERLKKINPFLSEDMLIEDSWDQIYSSNMANAAATSGDYTQTLDDIYREEIWKEKNTSDGGMMLIRKTQSSNILQVGMLVAYRKNIRKNSPEEKLYNLGIIRWLRIHPNKGMAIGIFNLSDNCQAVAVKAVEGVGHGSDFNQALLITTSSSHSSQSNQNYLIVPSGIYNTNTILELWHNETLVKVKITHKIMTSNTIMQVQFTAVD